jgi:hypothetical protein
MKTKRVNSKPRSQSGFTRSASDARKGFLEKSRSGGSKDPREMSRPRSRENGALILRKNNTLP